MQPGSQHTIDSAALQHRRAAAGYEECKINREAAWEEKKKKKGILERQFLDPDSDLLTGSRSTPVNFLTQICCVRYAKTHDPKERRYASFAASSLANEMGCVGLRQCVPLDQTRGLWIRLGAAPWLSLSPPHSQLLGCVKL